MRKIPLVGLIFCLLVLFCSSAPLARQNIGILPFKDNTGYDGGWDIQKGIATWLGEAISQNPFYQIVPTDTLTSALKSLPPRPKKGARSCLFGLLFPKRKKAAVHERSTQIREIVKKAGVDVLITGEINKFSLSRFQAGLPMLAGYESYSSTVELQASLQRVIDGKPLGTITGRAKVTDRDLGLSLFGKASDKALEFYGLDTLRFGSEEFKKTVLGRAAEKAIEQLKTKLEQIVVPPPLPKVSQPAILLVENNDVYVNIGIEDSIQVGDKFSVFSRGKELRDPVSGMVLGYTEQKVGVIRIILIQAAHLSKAEIMEGKERIEPGNLIRIE
ncbi:MAG: hypothetical protein J7J76_01735 [Candidatus Latescibacteria bacterium]|nr:hypothetical protein [Candidatus Latescibacterota bacterium]